MSTIEDQIIARRERGDVTIDEIMRAVVDSQDMALAWYRKEEDSYGTLNNQYLVIGELIAAALADARRDGAEQMREACLRECREIEEAQRAAYKKRYSAHAEGASDGATDCAAMIYALPLPTGARQAVLLTDEQIDRMIGMHWGDTGVAVQSVADFAARVEAAVLAANGLEAQK